MKKTILTRKTGAGRRPRKQVAAIDSRAAILAAARGVFAQKGYEGTSTREVAEAAGVNNAMIYYHFKGKDDMYRSVIADSFSAVTAIWDDPVFSSPVTVQSKIAKFVEGYIRFHQANDELRRIMAMEFAGSGGNICWICDKYFSQSFSRLTALFREGIRKGELKKIDPGVAVISLIGIIVHNFIMLPFAEQTIGKRVDLSPRKFGAFVTELFFHGLGSQGAAGKNHR